MCIPKIHSVGMRLVLGASIIALAEIFFGKRILCYQASLAIPVRLEVPRLQVEWVATVNVPINGVAHVCSVDGGREVVVQPQAVYPLTKSIEIVVIRQSCHKFDELVFIDEFLVLGCEDDISS